MSVSLEDRIVTITVLGKDYTGEVRQFEERSTCVVWVPSLSQTFTVNYADDAGRPGVYENDDGTTLTYHYKSWSNSGASWTKIKTPKRTVTN